MQHLQWFGKGRQKWNSKFANDSELFWAVRCWANDEDIQEDHIKVEICPVVRNFPYKLLYLAIVRPYSLTWSACLGLFKLAVEFLNSSTKYHRKGTFPFHFLKLPSSKLLLSVKKTHTPEFIPEENIRYNKKLQVSPEQKGAALTPKHWLRTTLSTHPQSSRAWEGGSWACPVVTLKEENPQSYLEDKNEQGLKSETTLHIFIPTGLTSWKSKDSPSKQLL